MIEPGEFGRRARITEYLDIDLGARRWSCNRCSHDLGQAERSYKEGCLITDRDPKDVHAPLGLDPEFNYSFDGAWVRLIEFYCPGCLVLLETEYLPPGHPLTWDIDLDVDALVRRHKKIEQL